MVRTTLCTNYPIPDSNTKIPGVTTLNSIMLNYCSRISSNESNPSALNSILGSTQNYIYTLLSTHPLPNLTPTCDLERLSLIPFCSSLIRVAYKPQLGRIISEKQSCYYHIVLGRSGVRWGIYQNLQARLI